MSEEKKTKTSIGGQAVLEGVMMRGKQGMALSVRTEDGEILTATERIQPGTGKWRRWPIVRGVINFVRTMILSVKTLMMSADAVGSEDEQLSGFGMFMAVALGLGLSVVLFMFLPSWIADLFKLIFGSMPGWAMSVIEAVVKVIIFVSYLGLVRIMKDIRRTYMYHGAEHKTISCFEKDLPLTVENVRTCPRVHDRCGTTFLFIVITISIIFFALTNWLSGLVGIPDAWWTRTLVRLIFIPFVAGISYEAFIALARAENNFIVRALKAPGLLLQRITTMEPDDQMIEVAITAFSAAYELDENPETELKSFAIDFTRAYAGVEKILKEKAIESAEADWIFCSILECSRTELKTLTSIKRTAYNKARETAKKRVATGKPLDYLLGASEFYGLKIKVNSAVLIPRPETELLAEKVIEAVKGRGQARVLDLCTGSGCIAAAVLGNTDATVTAADISPAALKIAGENAKSAELVQSDMFTRIKGKFDIIVCNPPYIRTDELSTLSEEVRHEPPLALDGGADGLRFYRILAERAGEYLNPQGILMAELGIGQAESVAAMFGDRRLEIFKDYAGIDRIMVVYYD